VRPLEVVERLAARDRADRGDDVVGAGGLADDAGGPAASASRTAAGRSATLWMSTGEPSPTSASTFSVTVVPSPRVRSSTTTSAGGAPTARRQER
jgi:hypothetical protein